MDAEQAWVPRLDRRGAERAGDDVTAKSPLGPGVPGPVLIGPQSPYQRGLPYSCTKPRAPEVMLHSGREGELSKTPGGPRLLGMGFPPPASFHGVAPPTDYTSLIRAVSQALGFPSGVKGNGEEAMRHNTFGVSSGTFHSH